MSLAIYGELEQGSDEWLQVRAGILTASVVGQLITPAKVQVSKSETARAVMETLLAERITGIVESIFTTFDMQRGQDEEPFARDLYAEHTGQDVDELGFMVATINGHRLGYSPDGLVGDDGLIEIKSRRHKKHLHTILADAVPPENYAQLQCGLLVSGRAWIDYVSFSAGMPLYIKRVTADERWQEAILAALDTYETYAEQALGLYQHTTKGMPTCPVIEMDIVI
ncbi:lambda exonuclease family protein [Brachybacterium sp. UMB0905]|uniref:lambda exonuclease family protein n=1 Tax=Brachybacterium sp. UMB0905 TaxID=2069310 RepID=UPI000C7FF012|nr:lambda exonuclease family protein [Brachybacterium sp. UMB0905]PMC76374.1 hypothetical protein CJ197_04255 [Brachybacterium sp. UMB0905]